MSKDRGKRSQVKVVSEIIPEEKKEEVLDVIVEAEETVQPMMLTGEVTCELLNVRKNPAKDLQPPVAVIAIGTPVQILESNNDEWYKVKLNTGHEGFCMRQFIKIIN